MLPKFLHLPTEILVHLLNSNFSLQELFHLRGLCRRLQALIESRQCIAKRKSLKLFWSFRDLFLYTELLYFWKLESDSALKLRSRIDDDDLILRKDTFTRSTCDWLARLFPHLAHLLILFNPCPISPSLTRHYPAIPYLITRYSDSLVRLSLFGIFSFIPGQRQFVDKLCSLMNDNLPNLKHLDIVMERFFYYYDVASDTHVDIPLNLSTRLLDQLEGLNLSMQRPFDASEQVLHQLNSLDSSCFTKLHIVLRYGPQILDLVRVQSSSRVKFDLVTHLTVLCHVVRWNEPTAFNHIGSLFTGLRSLCLEQTNNRRQAGLGPSAITILDVVQKLTNLSHLAELKLVCFRLSPLRHSQQLAERLSTITHLTIQDDLFEPSQIESLTSALFFISIRRIFPSIRTFYLKMAKSLPIEQQIDPMKHLNQFGALTRFELSIYPQKNFAFPHAHLYSVKHRHRLEQEFLPSERVNRIGPGQAGREIWIRKLGYEVCKEDKNNFEWIKKNTLVYDAKRLVEIADE